MKNTSKLERFDATLNELEEELAKLKDTSAAYEKLQALAASYKAITAQLEQNNQALEELMIQQVRKQQEIEEALSEIREANEEGHEKLRKENKELYFDLEKTLRIKLDEHKSEIKRLIEEERQKVKEIVEAEVRDWGQKILHTQKTIKNLALLFGITILLCAIAIIVIILI